MAGLDLTPNEFVGFRIKVDWYSYNVVIVKRHGPGSKNAGREYEKPVAYCKNVHQALAYILHQSLRMRAELAQSEQEALDGSIASAQAIVDQIAAAQADVTRAADELAERLKALGLSQKELVKALGAPEEAEQSDE